MFVVDTRIEKVRDFLNRFSVPHGFNRGKKWMWLEWHEYVVQSMLDATIDITALSMARGGGKSTFLSLVGILFVHPDGIFHKSNSLCLLVSQTQRNAQQSLRTMYRFLESEDGFKEKEWKHRESVNAAWIEHVETKSRIEVITSKKPESLHGQVGLVLAILDEPAQWQKSTARESYEVLESSLGKEDDAQLLICGTKPDDKQHWFNEVLENKRKNKSLRSLSYSAPSDAPINWNSVLLANPGIEQNTPLKKLVKRKLDALETDVSGRSAFRALRLNSGTGRITDTVFCTAEQWKARESNDTERRGAMFWGVDLSTNQALSCIACYWLETGRLEVVAACSEIPDIKERAKICHLDRVVFDRMIEEGDLHIAGNQICDIGELVQIALNRYEDRPIAISIDTWRRKEFTQELAGIDTLVGVSIIARSMRSKEGVEDFRAFKRSFLEGNIAPVPSTLQRLGLSHANVLSDQAHNQWIGKINKASLNDSLCASMLAVSAAREYRSVLEAAPSMLEQWGIKETEHEEAV